MLPLECYDIILGMDWLEQHSPMNVNWLKKTLSFWCEGKKVCLHGIKFPQSQCCMVWLSQLKDSGDIMSFGQELSLCLIETVELDMPQPIQSLLTEFDHLFYDPQGLPPRRPFDHTIPLLAGVRPVNLRPYRYSPAQEDKIEKQVVEMLSQGVIQPSSSPFSSPVLR